MANGDQILAISKSKIKPQIWHILLVMLMIQLIYGYLGHENDCYKVSMGSLNFTEDRKDKKKKKLIFGLFEEKPNSYSLMALLVFPV